MGIGSPLNRITSASLKVMVTGEITRERIRDDRPAGLLGETVSY